MKYDTKLRRLISLLMVLALSVLLAACGAKADPKEEAAPKEEEQTVQEDQPEEEDTEGTTAEAVKVIDEIDTEDMYDLPLQMESITLYDDGSVAIVPTEDLLRNAETNKELKDGAMHPFDDSGKVKDVFLVRYGNGGYRTIICLMEDGTLSAMSAAELIQDHIAVVWDNLTGRDTYVSVKNTQDESAWGVVGVTEDGEEIDLDFSLDF